ncbi:MAG: toxin-antitoxin system HicB family antitoxin [Elusimicrobia bacterium]|nr:toxin-antitoxin system HicB family antitoxin [Elusimicrobiota bacterium]
MPIPQALAGQKLGGRFLLRIPKALQHNLKEEAMEEGVSVNQYALFLISTARAQLHPFGRKEESRSGRRGWPYAGSHRKERSGDVPEGNQNRS